MTLCDIGNSTIAFLSKKRSFKIAIDTKWKKFPSIKGKIYFISVNKKITKKFLKKYPNAINCANFLHFSTTYQGMGIDRQVACKTIKDGIIIDAGSAITVDIMKNGDHKGGFILPGIKKLISFYPLISPKLNFHFEKKVNLDKIPNNTNEAISYAILKSVILPIKEIKNKYQLRIYFTGGDSKYLIKYFLNENTKNEYKYKKNLIFNSMKKIITQGKNRC